MSLSDPASTFSEDFYRFHWASVGVECIMERFSERGDDIATELTVNLDHPLYGGNLYSGRLLLIGPNSRRDVRRELQTRTGGGGDEDNGFDWGGMLLKICNLAKERYRRGEPAVDLAQVPFGDRPRFALRPYIAADAISIAYGDGKVAKSLMVLRWCIEMAQTGIRSLYLDWEDSPETHAERLAALCTGMDLLVPEDMIFYQRRAAPLSASVREIRRFNAEHDIGHTVVDSCGMAAGDPNDHGLIIEAVRAARSLGTTTLIHHLPKDAKDKSKPFGSVYASNEARLLWLFEKSQEDGASNISLLLTNQAFNRGAQQPKQAYKLNFLNDGDSLVSVSVEETQLADVPAFRSRLPQHQLIADVLKRNGRLRPPDIALALEGEGIQISANHIGVLLRRYEGKLFIRLEGGTWGCASTIQTV